MPAFGSSCVNVSHGFGYSRFEWLTDELRVQLTVTVDMELPLEILNGMHRKPDGKQKKLRLRCGADWVLGEKHIPLHCNLKLSARRVSALRCGARHTFGTFEWGFLSILGGSKSFAANGNQIAAEFTVEPQSTESLRCCLGLSSLNAFRSSLPMRTLKRR